MPIGDELAKRLTADDLNVFPYSNDVTPRPVRDTFTDEQVEFVAEWFASRIWESEERENFEALIAEWREEMANG